jgi:hypothetical protein
LLCNFAIQRFSSLIQDLWSWNSQTRLNWIKNGDVALSAERLRAAVWQPPYSVSGVSPTMRTTWTHTHWCDALSANQIPGGGGGHTSPHGTHSRARCWAPPHLGGRQAACRVRGRRRVPPHAAMPLLRSVRLKARLGDQRGESEWESTWKILRRNVGTIPKSQP